MKKYKGIIFDLDGTLLNTIEDLTDSVNDVMDIYHFPKHNVKACKMMVGNGFRKLITRALPEDKQKDETFIDEALMKFAQAYKRGDYTTALVDKFFSKNPMVAVYGERESEGIPKKPDPAAALQIAEQMHLSVKEVLYIGDSKTDMKTGQNAGMDTIGVAWGFRGPDELKQHHATYIVEKPEDILNYV